MDKKTDSDVNNGYRTHNDHMSILSQIKMYERIVKKSPHGGAAVRLDALYKKRYKHRKWAKLPYGIRRNILNPIEE
mgnify:CR=1 FL=1|tara:strand:+ start:3937 stop:4164 length:228 start_codon:yes stop_codon:yes gene_type:complete